MENMNVKIETKQDTIKRSRSSSRLPRRPSRTAVTPQTSSWLKRRKKQLAGLLEQLEKLEIQKTDKDENKTISLNLQALLLGPRISVGQCKKHEVPKKVYNKTQREKFRWPLFGGSRLQIKIITGH